MWLEPSQGIVWTARRLKWSRKFSRGRLSVAWIAFSGSEADEKFYETARAPKKIYELATSSVLRLKWRTHTYQPRLYIPLSLKVKSRHLRSSGLQLKASRHLQNWRKGHVTKKRYRQSKYFLFFESTRKRKFTNYLLINIAFIGIEWICIVELSFY